MTTAFPHFFKKVQPSAILFPHIHQLRKRWIPHPLLWRRRGGFKLWWCWFRHLFSKISNPYVRTKIPICGINGTKPINASWRKFVKVLFQVKDFFLIINSKRLSDRVTQFRHFWNWNALSFTWNFITFSIKINHFVFWFYLLN